MDKFPEKSSEEYVSYFESINTRFKSDQFDLSSDEMKSVDLSLESSSSSENIKRVLQCIETQSPKTYSESDTEIDISESDTISIDNSQFECDYNKLSPSTRELELKYEMNDKNKEIYELNKMINSLKQIIQEKDYIIENKDKNICFLMRSQKESNKKHLCEKTELKQLIENLQNDSWTNLNPTPECVSVLVQTDNDKTMNDNEINKAMISMKLKMNQKSKEWTSERKTLLEKIDELEFKLNDSIKENNELIEKLEKKSASSSESIEIVESLTQNDKFEIAKISNQISDNSVQTDENFEIEKKELIDKVNQLITENSEQSIQIKDLENLLLIREIRLDEVLRENDDLNTYVDPTCTNLQNSLKNYEAILNELKSGFQIDNIDSIPNAFKSLMASNEKLRSRFEDLTAKNEILNTQLDENQLIFHDIIEKFSLKDINDIFHHDIDKNRQLNEKLKKLVALLKKRNCEIDELKQVQNLIVETLSNNLEEFTLKFSEMVSNRILQLNNKLVVVEQNYFNSFNKFKQLRDELNEKSAILDEIQTIQYRDCAAETDRTVLVFDQSNYDEILSRIAHLESTLTNEQTMRLKFETIAKKLESDIQELIDQQQSLQRILENYRNPHNEESIVCQESFTTSSVNKLPIIPENEHEDVLDISCASYFSSDVPETLCIQRDMYQCGANDNNNLIDNENTNIAVSQVIQKSAMVLVDEVKQIIFENEQIKRALENSQINIRNQRQKSDIELQIVSEKYDTELEKFKHQIISLENDNNTLKYELENLQKIKDATSLEYENQIDLLESGMTSLKNEYLDLKTNYEQCKENCEILTNQNNELHVNSMSTIQELSNYSKKLIEKSELIEAQTSELCKLRDELSILNKNKYETENMLKIEIETYKNFETKYISLQKEYDDKIQYFTFEKIQLERGIECERISFQNQIQELEIENVQVKNDIEIKRKNLEAIMLENNNLQKLFDTQTENFNNLMNNFQKTDDKLNQQLILFNDLSAENNSLREKITKVEFRNETLSNDFDSIKLLNENLKSEKENSAQEIKDMSFRILHITKEFETMKFEYDNLKEELQNALSEKRGLLKKVEDTKILMRALQAETFKLLNHISDLEEEIKTLKENSELKIEEKDNEIEKLNTIVEQLNEENEISKEYLEKRIENLKASIQQDCESSGLDTNDQICKLNTELDRTLYVLYQRDLRCEELTFELENLLRERDALQICLSNALRLNEQLKTCEPASTDAEHLRDKLSELQSVSYLKDIRLKDEREYRHAQQASILSDNRIVTTKPLTEEIINRSNNAQSLKNNTIDEDSQQSSSSLLSWLWRS